MEVDTGAFAALTEQVATLGAEVAGLRAVVVVEDAHAAEVRESLITMGRLLQLREQHREQAGDAARRRSRRPRPRYLQVLAGGAS